MAQPFRGPIRCPACGQQALPHQSRCLNCNYRLNEALPVEAPPQILQVVEERAADIITVAPIEPDTQAFTDKLVPEGRRCPGCAAALGENAVLCVQCGYDFRLGKARATVVEKPKKESRAERRRVLVRSYFL